MVHSARRPDLAHMLPSVAASTAAAASSALGRRAGRSPAAFGLPELPITPSQALLLVTLVGALAYVWYVGGRGRWHALASERLLYGVPWGTLLTVSIVVAFYLFAQGGLGHWREPLYLPYVSWSYFYPTGLLTAGVAHASPEHLLSNVAATLALGPIAEFAWSHYAPASSASEEDAAEESDDSGAEGAPREPSAGAGQSEDPPEHVTDGGVRSVGLGVAVLDRPWVRAVVVFPVVVLVVSYVTSMLSLGPSLGFSGAVFAIAGFALVTYPTASLIGILVGSSIGTLYSAFAEPVVRGTVETGPPRPPSWAGVAFQAHFLGFLIGVLLGLAVLHYTDRRPGPTEIFLATLLFGLVQGLWTIVLDGGQDVFLLYRAVGVAGLLVLCVLVTAAVAGSDTDGDALPELPSARAVRLGATALLLLVAVLVVLPSPFASLGVVDASSDDGETVGGVTVEDYTVTYAENATSRYRYVFDAVEEVGTVERSGVIVVNPDRDIWTVAVRERLLDHDGDATVAVGGVDWRETVHVDRVGWDVVGGETAYAVDLTVHGDRTRSFRSEPVTATGRLDGYQIVVEPTDDAFRVALRQDGERVDAVPIPENGSATQVGNLTVTTEVIDDTPTVAVERGDARVPIAERETFDG